MFWKLKPPEPPDKEHPWSVVSWPLRVAEYEARVARRAEKIRMLKAWIYFFGSVTALWIAAMGLDHLNGYDNGNTGTLFWFLSTSVCGIGWIFERDRVEKLKRAHAKLERQYSALMEKANT